MIKINHSDDLGKLAVRITVGGLMLFHGIAKIVHPGSLGFIEGSLASIGLPPGIAYGVYLGEVVASLMVIFGCYTRAGGLIIVINMIFAVILAHSGELLSLSKHGGWALELQAFYLLGGLSVALLGSGKYAIRPDN